MGGNSNPSSSSISSRSGVSQLPTRLARRIGAGLGPQWAVVITLANRAAEAPPAVTLRMAQSSSLPA